MNRTELDVLIHTYQQDVYRYVRFLGAESADAEDVVQETFFAVCKNPGGGPKQPDSPEWGAWLRGIARNQFLQLLRRSKRETKVMQKGTFNDADAFWEHELKQDQEGIMRKKALKACLEQLPERQRSALAMRYEQAYSREKMADALSMKINGVKSFLRRIRTALGNCIRKRLEGRTV